MYEISKVEIGRIFKVMLWNPDDLLSALYELRNQGFLSKISEIDDFRQFTTKFSLGAYVDKLTDL